MLAKKLFSVLAILTSMTLSFGAFAQKIAVRGMVSDASGSKDFKYISNLLFILTPHHPNLN